MHNLQPNTLVDRHSMAPNLNPQAWTHLPCPKCPACLYWGSLGYARIPLVTGWPCRAIL